MKHIKLFEEWLTDKSQPFLFEGGAAGHMQHPFDNKELTFGDFKAMVDAGLRGQLNFEEEPTEKTDGQNLFVTIQDGKVKFARNKGQMANPLDLSGTIDMFTGHASKLVEETFILAAKDLDLQTAAYTYASSAQMLKDAVMKIGMPCVVKPLMSSSGKGQSTIKSQADIEKAWLYSQEGSRGDVADVIVEAFIDFDYEITLLTVTQNNGHTLFCQPTGS